MDPVADEKCDSETEKNSPWGLARISHRDTLNFGSFNKYFHQAIILSPRSSIGQDESQVEEEACASSQAQEEKDEAALEVNQLAADLAHLNQSSRQHPL
jgi:hypothetical protein